MRLCGPNKCAKFFSYQWPNKKIHGVACFFVADLLADPVVFKNQTNQPILYRRNWLNQLHNYDRFSRCIIIKWYVEDSIDLRDIGFKEEACIETSCNDLFI